METEFKVVLEYGIQVCNKTLSRYKANQESARQWWDDWADVCNLILPADATKRLMENTAGDWSHLESELLSVSGANDFGFNLFCKQSQKVHSNRLSTIARLTVADHLEGHPITAALVHTANRCTTRKSGAWARTLA